MIGCFGRRWWPSATSITMKLFCNCRVIHLAFLIFNWESSKKDGSLCRSEPRSSGAEETERFFPTVGIRHVWGKGAEPRQPSASSGGRSRRCYPTPPGGVKELRKLCEVRANVRGDPGKVRVQAWKHIISLQHRKRAPLAPMLCYFHQQGVRSSFHT